MDVNYIGGFRGWCKINVNTSLQMEGNNEKGQEKRKEGME
jgi:hypothetical protein